MFTNGRRLIFLIMLVLSFDAHTDEIDFKYKLDITPDFVRDIEA